MQCPRDAQALETRTVEGVEIDACPVCHGIYLEPGELEAIEEAHAAHAEKVPDEEDPVGAAMEQRRQSERPGADCPRCGVEMSPHEYAYASQIVVDTCPECGGTWLDAGELERIEAFFQRQRAEARSRGSVLVELLRNLGIR